jgi:hypothetical protein
MLVVIILSPTVVFSQFNDTTNYYFNYASTGIINKTNEGTSFVLNNAMKFNVYKKKYALNTTNAWIYGEQRNSLSNNDYHAIADFSIFKEERGVYCWGLVNFERSYSLKINHRLQAGAGIGYYIFDRTNFVIQLSDGILYDKTDLFDTETSMNNYETPRNSFRIKFRFLIHGNITVESSDFLQHSLEDKKDYIIKSITTVGVKLKKWLAFNVALNYNKLSITGRENLLCNFGLSAEKYF